MEHGIVDIQQKRIEQALSHISAMIANAFESLQQAKLQEQAAVKMLLQSQMDLEKLYLSMGKPEDKSED